ncbi:hypothetical protein [Roseivivax sp. CAU 1753]
MRFMTIFAIPLALAACADTNMQPGVTSTGQDFALTGVSVPAMNRANLCTDLGGQGTIPAITITHSAVAGVPITVRMYDNLSNGAVFEHGSTRVMSDADGTTVVTHTFRPPCNTTGGARNSSYNFDVVAAGAKITRPWGTYNSATGAIGR